jgi:hypothetical protein
MFSAASVMHFLLHERPRLSGGGFALSLRLPSAFQCSSFRHCFSSAAERYTGLRPWMI